MGVLTVTSLRENLFKVVDRVILSGIPQEIERKGKKLKIVMVGKINKFDNLIPHNSIIGRADKLINQKPYIWKEPENL